MEGVCWAENLFWGERNDSIWLLGGLTAQRYPTCMEKHAFPFFALVSPYPAVAYLPCVRYDSLKELAPSQVCHLRKIASVIWSVVVLKRVYFMLYMSYRPYLCFALVYYVKSCIFMKLDIMPEKEQALKASLPGSLPHSLSP